MDAVKFFTEKKRMCATVMSCCICPMVESNAYHDCTDFEDACPEEAVGIVEQWSKEHPIMTNKMKFEEVFGKACVEIGELVLVRPSWWMEEYHEPKGDEEE